MSHPVLNIDLDELLAITANLRDAADACPSDLLALKMRLLQAVAIQEQAADSIAALCLAIRYASQLPLRQSADYPTHFSDHPQHVATIRKAAWMAVTLIQGANLDKKT